MKKLITLCFAMASTVALAQQDPLYSQYMQNPFLINPAYAGTYDMFSATANFRWQWLGMGGAPNTNSLSAHSSIVNNRLGAGVILVNDRFGINNNTEAHGALAYKLRLSDSEDNVLSFGMQASMVNYRFDNTKLNKRDDTDPYFRTDNVTATEPNFGAGLFYRGQKFFAGFSAPKVLNSTFAEDYSAGAQYRRHFFLTGGYLIDLTNVQVKPSFLLKYVQGAPVSVDINGSVLLKDVLWLGASLRNLNSAVLMAQLQISDMFRVGYSVDLPMSKVLRATYGSHELMLNMDLKLLKSHDIGFRYF